VRSEQVGTSIGSEAAFVFPARRGRMRLALTPTRVIATSAAGTVELPWNAVADVKADAFAGEAEDLVRAIKRYQRDARRRRSIGDDDEHARILRELGKRPARA
jgi:hypothetical protein